MTAKHRRRQGKVPAFRRIQSEESDLTLDRFVSIVDAFLVVGTAAVPIAVAALLDRRR